MGPVIAVAGIGQRIAHFNQHVDSVIEIFDMAQRPRPPDEIQLMHTVIAVIALALPAANTALKVHCSMGMYDFAVNFTS